MVSWNRTAFPAVFRQAGIHYGTVVWPGEIDIASEAFYDDSIPLL